MVAALASGPGSADGVGQSFSSSSDTSAASFFASENLRGCTLGARRGETRGEARIEETRIEETRFEEARVEEEHVAIPVA